MFDATSGDTSLLASLLDASPYGTFWKDRALVYVGCNEAYARYLGLPGPADIAGKTDEDLLPAELAATARAKEASMLASGDPRVTSFEDRTAPGSPQPRWRISRRLLQGPDGETTGIAGFLEDLSTLVTPRADSSKSDRARSLLRNCTSCILGSEAEADLLDHLCTLILGAGYRMVWFGSIGNDAEKTIRPIAQGGLSEAYLNSLNVTWSDTPRGRGPTGTAVRERRTYVNQNFHTNPAMLPWRAAALAEGFQASIAVPLVYRGDVLAVVTIYATEPDAFDAGEVQLLEELARNISIGLGALRERGRRLEELAAANKALANLARHDILTGLPNRLAADERLRLEFVTMKRTGRCYAVLMLDIDHFKMVNDSHGHRIGDRILTNIGAVIQKTIRGRDFVCRFGGEEFLAILPETDAEGGLIVAEKIRKAVFDLVDPLVGQVTLSAGVAVAKPTDQTEDDAVKAADERMYMAKSTGRNRAVS